ncbi:MAG: vWA domain-containing protein [Alphaproteobacteria bacterium]
MSKPNCGKIFSTKLFRATAFVGATLAGVLGFAAPSAMAAEKSALFILDASGSMWGRIGSNLTKIEAARTVMGNLVRQVPGDVQIGLIAYGHRRKGDCADIEMVQPLAKGAGAAIAAKVARLIPRGKTPISDSLIAGAGALAGRQGSQSLILVSDGIETCNKNACEVVAALAKAEVDLKIHVVGLDVDAKTRRQLECIAREGRGTYFNADNVDELTKALNTVTKAVVMDAPVVAPVVAAVAEQPKAAPPVAAQPQVKSAEVKIRRIKIKGPGTIKIAPAPWVKTPPYFWKIIDPETGKELAKTRKNQLRVKPGTYQLSWRHVEHGASEVDLPVVVSVGAGETVEAKIDTGLRLVPPAGMKRPYYWVLRDADKQKIAQFSVWDAVPVPSGRYSLALRQTEHGNGAVDMGEIDVTPGKLNEIVLDQGIDLGWPESWLPDAKNKVYRFRTISQSGFVAIHSYRGLVVMAPGKYKISVRLKEHGWSEVPWGEIVVPEKGFVSPNINSGITFISNEEKPRQTIFATNLDTKDEAKLTNRWGPFALPPGRYRFDLKPNRGDRLTIIDELDINAGEMIEAEM